MAIRRLKIEKTAYYAQQEPEYPKDDPPDLLIALHGYGQLAEKFLQTFTPLKNRNITVVAPQASNQFYVKLTPKIIGSTWLTQFERDQAIEDFLNYMQRLFANLQSEISFNPQAVFLLGFSQGVSMAYRLLCAKRIPVAGLVACSADIPGDVLQHLPGLRQTPILITHGNDDSIVPRTAAEAALRELRKQQFNVEKYSYPGGHVIPSFVVEKIFNWCSVQKQTTNLPSF